jgi:hypothetical protein
MAWEVRNKPTPRYRISIGAEVRLIKRAAAPKHITAARPKK